MKRGFNLVIVLLGVFLFLTFVSAALDLKITGEIGNYSSDVYMRTNALSSNGLDIYDMLVPSMPDDYSKFFSDTGSYEFSIDSWSTNPRTLNVVYETSSAQTGGLDLSWDSLSGTDYAATLTNYGDDSAYSASVGSSDMRASTSYTATMSSATKNYFQVAVTDYSPPSGSSSSSSSSSSGGGGGGGSGALSEDRFSLDGNKFNVNIVLEDVKSREFTLKNKKNQTIEVNLIKENLEGLILIDDKVSLGPFEEKTVKFKLVAPDETGVYPGTIILRSGGDEETVFVTLNVNSKETLFDISVLIPSDKLLIKDILKVQLHLLPVGEKGVDVSIRYFIKDFKGQTYYERSETFYVDEEMSFIEEFETDKLEEGDYVLGTEITYISGVAVASAQFEVVGSQLLSKFNVSYKFLIFIGIAVLIVVVILFEIKRKRFKLPRRRKIKR